MDGPGIQLAEGHFQKHAVEGRDQIYVLQTVEQRLPAKEGCDEETSMSQLLEIHRKKITSVISTRTQLTVDFLSTHPMLVPSGMTRCQPQSIAY